ncbi:hypothetical protein OWV82_024536 [Melia azedarach]|uniref:Uncharacterized protein n=1 Tax=Melia azedarach TaxID=155640 RepID=A0ACC1WQ91_MELAZ|nr:hypothetical protein OWV82_024536 [Melia azedarach]
MLHNTTDTQIHPDYPLLSHLASFPASFADKSRRGCIFLTIHKKQPPEFFSSRSIFLALSSSILFIFSLWIFLCTYASAR